MRVYTTVRIRALDAEEALNAASSLLGENCGDGRYFDYLYPEETRISEKVKTDDDFAELRARELAEYRTYLTQALEQPDDDDTKAVYLIKAGEALIANNLDTSECLAYDHASEEQEETEGEIFFVETTRHC